MNERMVSLDAKRLRAMAHPLRVRLIGVLRLDGPSTATALGKRLGENSANMSWHLRRLAEAGLVVEDSERGNRRERWWAAAHDVTTANVRELSTDPELAGSLGAYLHAINAAQYDSVANYISQIDSWAPEWRNAAEVSDRRLHLSADELAELGRKLDELVCSYLRDPRAGDAEVAVQWRSAPLRNRDNSDALDEQGDPGDEGHR